MLETTIIGGRITIDPDKTNMCPWEMCSIIFEENRKEDYRRVRVVLIVGKREVYNLEVSEEIYKELYQFVNKSNKESSSVVDLDEIDWKTYVMLSEEYIASKKEEIDNE